MFKLNKKKYQKNYDKDVEDSGVAPACWAEVWSFSLFTFLFAFNEFVCLIKPLLTLLLIVLLLSKLLFSVVVVVDLVDIVVLEFIIFPCV